MKQEHLDHECPNNFLLEMKKASNFYAMLKKSDTFWKTWFRQAELVSASNKLLL